MSRISIKGVLIGSVVDIVLTNIASWPLAFFVISDLSKSGVAKDQLLKAAVDAMQMNTSYFVIGMLIGSFCSIIGGFVSAKIAKKAELLNGALASILCVANGLYSWLAGSYLRSWWFHVIAITLSIILAMFGGYIARSRNLKSAAA